MDAIGWIIAAAAVGLAVAAVAVAPRLKRESLRRQLDGDGSAGSFAGLGIGLDAVWRPSAEEARADWEAQVELPAPAPAPGDKGGVEEGRIVIEIDSDR